MQQSATLIAEREGVDAQRRKIFACGEAVAAIEGCAANGERVVAIKYSDE